MHILPSIDVNVTAIIAHEFWDVTLPPMDSIAYEFGNATGMKLAEPKMSGSERFRRRRERISDVHSAEEVYGSGLQF